MKPRPFRLARVLQLRRRELDHAATGLAQAESRLAHARAQGRAKRGAVRDAVRSCEAILGAGTTAGEYSAMAFAADAARDAAKRAGESETACEAQRDAARASVLDARTKVRALEGMRDRRAREERAWRERIAQKQLDEIASRQATHREREAS